MIVEPVDKYTILVRTPQGNLIITDEGEHKTEIKIITACFISHEKREENGRIISAITLHL